MAGRRVEQEIVKNPDWSKVLSSSGRLGEAVSLNCGETGPRSGSDAHNTLITLL